MCRRVSIHGRAAPAVHARGGRRVDAGRPAFPRPVGGVQDRGRRLLGGRVHGGGRRVAVRPHRCLDVPGGRRRPVRVRRPVDAAVRPVALAVLAFQRGQAELPVDPVDADRAAGRGLRDHPGHGRRPAGVPDVPGPGVPLVRRRQLLRANAGPVVPGRRRAHRVRVLDRPPVAGGGARRIRVERAGRAGHAGLRQVPRHGGRVRSGLPVAVRPRPAVLGPTGPGVRHPGIRRARRRRGRHKNVRRHRERGLEVVLRQQIFFASQ